MQKDKFSSRSKPINGLIKRQIENDPLLIESYSNQWGYVYLPTIQRSLQAFAIRYRMTRHDENEEDITYQGFNNYEDVFYLIMDIYGDMLFSDADYEDHPYYEIVETKE